jgi:hypothetical protein
MKKAKVAVARKIAVLLHCLWVDGTSFEWGTRRWRSSSTANQFSSFPGGVRDVPAGTAVAVTSLFRLRTTLPYLVPDVDAPDPNIIMRHSTSERTMTPAMAGSKAARNSMGANTSPAGSLVR